MQPDTIVCRRCGVANPAGDQFCGSCGAFLEWEGTEPEPPPGDAAFNPDLMPAIPVAPEPAPAESATQEAVPEPVPPTAPTPPGPAPQPGFTVCPTCGSGNPPGRTFCHSCGNLLSKAPAGMKPGESAGRDATGKAPARGGLPRWLPIVIGAGLLVGIAFIVLTVVLKPAAPPSVAFPSATLTPTLEFPPSVSLPPASVGASSGASSGAPPVAPGGSVQLALAGATASSVAADTPDVAAVNVIDGRLDTRWQEAVGSQPGEWVEVTFAASRLDYVVVYAGFQLSHDSFTATRRPQNVVVTVNGGPPVGYLLADSELPQRIDIADTPAATVVRIQIASTFPAAAGPYPGSPIEATAISEIRAFGAAGG